MTRDMARKALYSPSGRASFSAARHRNRNTIMNGTNRSDIHPGLKVRIVLKQDQRTGKLTEGIVRNLLTKAPYHSRGIKVRLESGLIGRVHEIIG
jgi:uncharacterized repeat protein (TIGR03833 family)